MSAILERAQNLRPSRRRAGRLAALEEARRAFEAKLAIIESFAQESGLFTQGLGEPVLEGCNTLFADRRNGVDLFVLRDGRSGSVVLAYFRQGAFFKVSNLDLITMNVALGKRLND